MPRPPFKPRYSYAPRGRVWRVYKNEYTGPVCTGTTVAEFRTREEARELTYKLNGWKMKPEQ